MTTGLDIIKSAMRRIGALTKSEAPDADEAQDALDALNDLLASWSNDGLTTFARKTEQFTLVGGQSEYQYGLEAGSFSSDFSSAFSGGVEDFIGKRPIKLVAAFVRIGATDYPLRIINDVATFLIRYKGIGGIPEFISSDNSYPFTNIRIYPTPAAAYPLYLMTEKPLDALTLAGDMSLPPGWERALKANLAVELAPEYGQQVSQEMQQAAMKSLGQIRKAIMRARPLDWRPLSYRTNNIYSGFE